MHYIPQKLLTIVQFASYIINRTVIDWNNHELLKRLVKFAPQAANGHTVRKKKCFKLDFQSSPSLAKCYLRTYFSQILIFG